MIAIGSGWARLLAIPHLLVGMLQGLQLSQGGAAVQAVLGALAGGLAGMLQRQALAARAPAPVMLLKLAGQRRCLYAAGCCVQHCWLDTGFRAAGRAPRCSAVRHAQAMCPACPP